MPAPASTPETIDGKAARSLVDAHAIRGVTILGQPGGWAVLVRYGALERAIAAQRSRRMRLFRRLETAAAFVRDELGLPRFEVDAADRPDSAGGVRRPDQAERLRRQREAAEHNAWFRVEVEQGLREAGDPSVKRIPHAEVMRKLDERIARLRQRLAADAASDA